MVEYRTDTMSQRLEAHGFAVTGASNGTEALEAARTGGFDLALVDLRMPGMDGIGHRTLHGFEHARRYAVQFIGLVEEKRRPFAP